MAENFVGEWKLVSSENFNALLKQLDVNPILRKVARKTKPRLIFEKNNDLWKFTVLTPISTYSTDFKLGEMFEKVSPTGYKFKMVFKFEDGKFIQTDYDDDGKTVCQVSREIDENGLMKTVAVAGNVICTRVFKKTK